MRRLLDSTALNESNPAPEKVGHFLCHFWVLYFTISRGLTGVNEGHISRILCIRTSEYSEG